jgi:ribose/xylose/arabinose/galactoside ABC-type transport system permease subunit
MIAGVFAGIYAFMSIGTNGAVLVVTEMGTLSTAFDAMMCVFIAMSLASLTNPIFGAFIGALLLQIIKLGLMVLHIPTELTQIIVALFVLMFMAYSGTKVDIKKRLQSRASKKLVDSN